MTVVNSICRPSTVNVGPMPRNICQRFHAIADQTRLPTVFDSISMTSQRYLLLILASICSCAATADEFQYLDQDGRTQTVEGQVYATDSTKTAVLQDDGSLEIIPSALITKRTPAESPAFITAQQALDRLKEKYGAELFRGTVAEPFVVGVVLQAPVPKKNERRLTRALERAASYMQSVEESFDRFMTSLSVELSKPDVPLVLLIFESDDDFEDFATNEFGRSSLSAEMVKGFYSNLSNVLYVRMSECATFDTPLHEAIHQLCFNKGLFRRLAPVPLWLAEGMACSFEGSGTKVRSNPTQLNSEYSAELIERSRDSQRFSGMSIADAWSTIVVDDGIYRTEQSINAAYISSWSLHWILVRKYKKQYAEYLKYIRTLEPLEDIESSVRLAEFRKAFDVTPNELKEPFRKSFLAAAKDSRHVRRSLEPDGVSKKESHLAVVSIYAARDAQRLVAHGELKNISPFREMAYYVCVQTDGARNIQWFLPSVRMGKVIKLRRQQTPVGGSLFRVSVRSTPAGSATAADWAAGRVPVLPRFSSR